MTRATRCPICKRSAEPPASNADFPFCGARCKTIDLARWLGGAYALDPATGSLEEIDPEQAEEVSLEEIDA